MDARPGLVTVYEPTLCLQCVSLVGGERERAPHSRLGRPRAEVGYSLYRCAACHARWSVGPGGWRAEAGA